jgi:hypothetical protein
MLLQLKSAKKLLLFLFFLGVQSLGRHSPPSFRHCERSFAKQSHTSLLYMGVPAQSVWVCRRDVRALPSSVGSGFSLQSFVRTSQKDFRFNP